MAPKTDKRINVSGTVTPALHEFVEEYRWSHRLSKSDVINAALEEWGKAQGFTEPKADEAKGDEAVADEAKPTPARRK